MATLSAIRDALRTVIDEGIATLHAYDTVPDVVNLPAMVVMPGPADFAAAFARGLDTYTLKVYVLASNRNADLGQDDLDSFVTGAGPNSIRRVVWENKTLGLASTNAHVSGMEQYGGQFSTAGVEHIGAILNVTVTSLGAA